MHISPFKLERFFANYEFKTRHLLCCSDCESYSIAELLDMEHGAYEKFLQLNLGYTESQGHPELRHAIADLYTTIEANDILVHSGAEEAIFNFMNAVLSPGDHIIVHAPCYQSLREIAHSIGCDITDWLANENDQWRLDLDFLKDHLRKNTKIVVLNCPHNPTGYVMNHSDFNELVKLSQTHGFLIFSDEVYRFLEYDPENRLPSSCDVDDRGVALGVMSKSFGLAGLRIGWIATRNHDVLNNLAEFKDYTTICNSAPAEFLATIALRHRAKILQRNMQLLHNNLKALHRFFTTYDDIFEFIPPLAGPIAYPKLLHGDINKFCSEIMEKANILLLPGRVYEPFYNNFRIGFGRANFQEGLSAFDTFMRTFYARS